MSETTDTQALGERPILLCETEAIIREVDGAREIKETGRKRYFRQVTGNELRAVAEELVAAGADPIYRVNYIPPEEYEPKRSAVPNP